MLPQLHLNQQFGAFINKKVTFSASTSLASVWFVLHQQLNFPFWFTKWEFTTWKANKCLIWLMKRCSGHQVVAHTHVFIMWGANKGGRAAGLIGEEDQPGEEPWKKKIKTLRPNQRGQETLNVKKHYFWHTIEISNRFILLKFSIIIYGCCTFFTSSECVRNMTVFFFKIGNDLQPAQSGRHCER